MRGGKHSIFILNRTLPDLCVDCRNHLQLPFDLVTLKSSIFLWQKWQEKQITLKNGWNKVLIPLVTKLEQFSNCFSRKLKETFALFQGLLNTPIPYWHMLLLYLEIILYIFLLIFLLHCNVSFSWTKVLHFTLCTSYLKKNHSTNYLQGT